FESVCVCVCVCVCRRCGGLLFILEHAVAAGHYRQQRKELSRQRGRREREKERWRISERYRQKEREGGKREKLMEGIEQGKTEEESEQGSHFCGFNGGNYRNTHPVARSAEHT